MVETGFSWSKCIEKTAGKIRFEEESVLQGGQRSPPDQTKKMDNINTKPSKNNNRLKQKL